MNVTLSPGRSGPAALLAGGGAVKDVALEAGYETPSAFVAAFKKHVGTTPGKTKHEGHEGHEGI